jgi:predicted nucleic acid-binding protein
VIAVDTSVVVAGFASWHEGHADSAAALRRAPKIPAHALIETYSVLTRLPPPHRAQPALVAGFLAKTFGDRPLALPPAEHVRLVELCASLGMAGGSVHDALIAMTVKHARGKLLTRDRRATLTYERLGVAYEWIG